MYPLLTVLLCGLATWSATECWRDGSIFERPRAYFEARGGFLGELLGCGYCLSFWVGAALTTCAMAAWAEGRDWAWLPVLWFGAVRLATLGLGHVKNPYAPAQGLQEASRELERVARDVAGGVIDE